MVDNLFLFLDMTDKEITVGGIGVGLHGKVSYRFDHFLRREIAVHPCQCRINGNETAVGGGGEDADRGIMDDVAEVVEFQRKTRRRNGVGGKILRHGWLRRKRKETPFATRTG